MSASIRWNLITSSGGSQLDKSGYTYIFEVVSDQDLPVRRFFLEPGDLVVGSAKDADISLSAEGVSRRHARLEIFADGGAPLSIHALSSQPEAAKPRHNAAFFIPTEGGAAAGPEGLLHTKLVV